MYFGFISSALKADPITEALAKIAVETKSDEISTSAITATKKAIIDVIGISYAGFQSPGMKEIREQFKEWGGNSQSAIWIEGVKLSAPDAAFVNSALVHALDLDDLHLPSHTHLTSVIIPAALAVGEYLGKSGQEVIESIICGLEVAGRLGRAYDSRVEHHGFLPTSIIGGFGAVASVSRLMGLSIDETMDAFGIFYAHASGNRQALYDRSLAKRIQPAIASKAGVVAGFLAKKGISGPHNIFLSTSAGLFRIYGANKEPYPTIEEILEPRDFFEVELLSYKMFASCGGGHPVILAAIELAKEYDISLDEIKHIELYILPGLMFGVPWENSKNPHVLAQFCSPYQVVTAIKNRKQGPIEIENKTILEDTEVYRMAAEKVTMRKRSEHKAPNKNQVIVVTLKNGQKIENYKSTEDVFGVNIMSYIDVVNKYLHNMEYAGVSKQNARSLLVNIEELTQDKPINSFVDQIIKY